MEENKKKSTTEKKRATKNKKKEIEKPVETELPQVDMNQMFQMFQQFMDMQMKQTQQNPLEEKGIVKDKSPIKKNKSYLRKERGDDDVLVRSVAGTVCFKSPKTGITYNFLENGDEEWLTVDEILQMETASKKYLHEPWLIVEDDEVNEILGIKKIAESVNILNNIEEAVEDMSIEEISELLKNATDDYKQTFGGVVLTKIQDGDIRDTVLIKELGKALNMDFDLYLKK